MAWTRKSTSGSSRSSPMGVGGGVPSEVPTRRRADGSADARDRRHRGHPAYPRRGHRDRRDHPVAARTTSLAGAGDPGGRARLPARRPSQSWASPTRSVGRTAESRCTPAPRWRHRSASSAAPRDGRQLRPTHRTPHPSGDRDPATHGRRGPPEKIARDLGMSKHTLRTHTQNVLTKLGVHSKLDADRGRDPLRQGSDRRGRSRDRPRGPDRAGDVDWMPRGEPASGFRGAGCGPGTTGNTSSARDDRDRSPCS